MVANASGSTLTTSTMRCWACDTGASTISSMVRCRLALLARVSEHDTQVVKIILVSAACGGTLHALDAELCPLGRHAIVHFIERPTIMIIGRLSAVRNQSPRLPSSSWTPQDQHSLLVILRWLVLERLQEQDGVVSSTWLSVARFVQRSRGFVHQIVELIHTVRSVAHI